MHQEHILQIQSQINTAFMSRIEAVIWAMQNFGVPRKTANAYVKAALERNKKRIAADKAALYATNYFQLESLQSVIMNTEIPSNENEISISEEEGEISNANFARKKIEKNYSLILNIIKEKNNLVTLMNNSVVDDGDLKDPTTTIVVSGSHSPLLQSLIIDFEKKD